MKDIMYRLFGPDPVTLDAYRTVIPGSIRINNEDDGNSIVIRVTEINGEVLEDDTLLITQVNKKSEVVPAVNDLIMTYYDIPNELRRYYEKTLTLEGHLNKNAVLTKAA